VREQGATAVYITHDQAEAFALGDEIGILHRGRLVQHGPPEVIYRTPASPFVARFTGVAGVLGGHLDGAGGAGPGPVRVLVASTDPARPLTLGATATAAIPPGSPVQVLLRPTATRICRTGSRPAQLRGTVRDVAYHGRGYDYVVAIGEHLELTGVFDRRRFDRGAVVELYITPTAALVFPDKETAEEATGAPVAAEAVLDRCAAMQPSEQGEATASSAPVSIATEDPNERW